MEQYELLKRLVTEVEEDVRKAAGGNKAAGTRVRKKMQEIKAAMNGTGKALREAIKAFREANPRPQPTTTTTP